MATTKRANSSSTGSSRPPLAEHFSVVVAEPRGWGFRTNRGADTTHALDQTIEQNTRRRERRVTLPVLTLAGSDGAGDLVGNTMKLVADDPASVVLSDTGPYPAEESPEAMLDALTGFLAPTGTRLARVWMPGEGTSTPHSEISAYRAPHSRLRCERLSGTWFWVAEGRAGRQGMKRTNAIWYLVALGLVLGGWVAAAAIAATSWQDLNHAAVTPINPGVDIAVAGKGAAFFTDIPQNRGVTCRSKPAKALTIDKTSFDISTRSDGRTWHLVSVTKDAKPGSYSVSCTPRDMRIDTANYGYAELPDFRNATIGNGVGSMATFAAAILAAWVYWGRRTERKLASYESA
jgi:hypothetical protein